jgi:hypothetical protein
VGSFAVENVLTKMTADKKKKCGRALQTKPAKRRRIDFSVKNLVKMMAMNSR